MRFPIAVLCTTLFIMTDCAVSIAAEPAPADRPPAAQTPADQQPAAQPPAPQPPATPQPAYFNFSWTAPDEYKGSRANEMRGLTGVRDDDTRLITPSAWVGTQLKALSEPIEKFGGSPGEVGVLFEAIVPDSPAAAAGLAAGDVLVAFDGGKIVAEGGAVSNILSILAGHKPGDKVVLTILRDKKRLEVEVVLGARKEIRMPQMPHPELAIGQADKPTLLEAALAAANLKQQYLTVRQMIRYYSNYVWDDGKTAAGVVNPFRLKRFTWAYENPSMASAAADQLVKEMQRHYNDKVQSPSGLIEEATRNLDAAVSKPDVPRGATPVESLLGAFAEAAKLRQQAFAGLTPDEVKLLETKSHYLMVEPQAKEEAQKEEKMIYPPTPQVLPEPAKEPAPDNEDKDKTDDKEKKKDEEEKPAIDVDQVCRIACKVDFNALFGAAYVIGRELEPDRVKELIEFASRMPRQPLTPEDAALFGGDVIAVRETPFGRLVVGGPGQTIYKGDAAIVIDAGGDDVYLNNAGGTTGEIRFAVLIDAAGRDIYAGNSRTQGFGQTGAGFVIDMGGDNDSYRGEHLCQGVGIFGVGMVIDEGGDDAWRGMIMCHGAATFGIGILADLGGSDNYHAEEFAQGFGYVKGFGALIDAAGNDVYFAGGRDADERDPTRSYVSFSQGVGFGHRNDDGISYSGGIGLLADGGGNNCFTADYFSQGSAYWFAMGILAADSGGNRFYCGRYSQGAGIHHAVGVLLDHGGENYYSAYFGVSQGCGHDLSVGIIENDGGRNKFVCGVIGIGAGNDNGIGMIVNHAGGNEYISAATNYSIARGGFTKERNFGSIGIILDLGGEENWFSDKDIVNYAVTTKTLWGISIQMPKKTEPQTGPESPSAADGEMKPPLAAAPN